MADIALERVFKSYGSTQVVHGIDLAIPDGCFCVILGPSGCGKSTVLRMIAGLEAIGAGTISIAGRVVNDRSPSERDIAMVFQNYALYPHMTVARNMGYALEIQRLPKARIAQKVGEAAAILGIGDLLDRKPGQLSGGQRQRVAMGRAIVREPSAFLFDEPLSNLDARLRVQMRMEIRNLHRRLGATSVFVTHDQIEAMTMADMIVVMNGGRIEQIGRPAEVYARPDSVFVAGFIGAPPMNLLAARVGPDRGSVAIGDRVLPVGDAAAAFDPGEEVVLGIRPEHVRLRPTPDAARAAPLDFVEDTGATLLGHFRVAGQPLLVALPADAGIDPSRPALLELPAQHLHLFDPANGRRRPDRPLACAA